LSDKDIKYFKDVNVGNEVYAFGYPTSITSVNPWLNIKLPLLRKGIVAGKNELLNAIIGNSGGLVMEGETFSMFFDIQTQLGRTIMPLVAMRPLVPCACP
jgi:hypothetical protein